MAIKPTNTYFTDFEDNGLFSGEGSLIADMFVDIVPELAPMTTAAVTAAKQTPQETIQSLVSSGTFEQYPNQAVLIGDTYYQPNYASTGSGETFEQGPLENVTVYKASENKVGGDVNQYTPTGEFQQTTQQQAVSNSLTPFLLGSAALFGGLGGGFEGLFGGGATEAATAAADADLAAGLIPEYGTNAAYDQFMASAIAPSEAIAAPVLEAPTAYYEPQVIAPEPAPVVSAPSVTPVETVIPTEPVVPEMVVTAPYEAPPVTASDLGIDYSLSNGSMMPPLTDMGGMQGIQPGVAANLEGMGGAQGLLINAGAPSTTLADAIATFGGVNPAYLPDMGGAQGLTYQTPTGLVTESAILPTGIPNVLDQVLGETGINTATNIGSGIGTELASINTGVPEVAPTTVTPTTPVTPESKSLLDSLTPSQAASLLKGALGLFGALSAGKAMGSGGGSNTFNVGALPTQGIPLNSQDYFNAIQQNYNTLLPQLPRDVATPLSQWYNTQYTGT